MEVQSRSDLVLVERALRQRWGVTAEIRQAALERCLLVLRDPQVGHALALRAIRVLSKLDEIDRRRDRDQADSDIRNRRVNLDAVEAALATPEGLAALGHLRDSLTSNPLPPKGDTPV